MATMTSHLLERESKSTGTMRALVFHGPNQIAIESVPVPRAGVGEAVLRVTLTTICGTDIHIVKGEYKVRPGLVIGHEPVGVIHELGEGVIGYKVGDRVLVGAITPCGQCGSCLSGQWSQCGGPIGGWKFGNTIHGAQAEYLLVPNAQANLANQQRACMRPGWPRQLRRALRLIRQQVCQPQLRRKIQNPSGNKPHRHLDQFRMWRKRPNILICTFGHRLSLSNH